MESTTMSNKKNANHLKHIKRIIWLVGVWPLTNDLFSEFRTFLFLMIQISLVTSVSIEISLGYASPEEAITYIELQKFGTVSALKVLLLRLYRKHLAEILQSAKEDWSSTMKPEHLRIMKGYEGFGNAVLYAQAGLSFVQIFFVILENIPTLRQADKNYSTNNTDDIFDERVLLLRTKCLLGDYSTTIYLSIYILQLLQCYSTACGNVGIDIFFFNVVMHICGQLEILYHEICDYTLKNDLKATKASLVALIKRHQHLLNEAKNLEKIFSLVILLQLIINTTGICSFGIQVLIALQNSDPASTIKAFVAVKILMMQLFWYCFAGDMLSSKISQINFASYQFSWYDVPYNLSMDVYFILMRTGQPFRLTAGKFMTMNMNSFSKILKVSLSYFSVLRLMLNT